MTINTTLSGDGSVFNIVLSGSVEIGQSLQMQDSINSLAASVKAVRIDLKHVTSLDASIFATLLLLNQNAGNEGVSLEIYNCSRDFARRFSLSGLDRFIKIRMSEDLVNEAIKKDQSTDNAGSGIE